MSEQDERRRQLLEVASRIDAEVTAAIKAKKALVARLADLDDEDTLVSLKVDGFAALVEQIVVAKFSVLGLRQEKTALANS